MWYKIISEFQKNNETTLDLKIELHLAYYIYNLLKDHYIFSILNDNLIIKDIKTNIEIDKHKFFYWYNFTRFQDIIKEEEKIFNEFIQLKDKILPVINKIKIPELKDSDDEQTKKKKIDKMTINNEKITKLQDHIKSEADSSNHKINTLRNFRSIYLNLESLDILLKNIQIIVENE